MSIRLISFVAVILAFAATSLADPKVDLVAATVRHGPEVKPEGVMFQDDGIELEFLVSLPSGAILGFDETNATLTTFKDDAGTDFSKTRGFGRTPWLGGFPQVTKDGKAMQFRIVSRIVPKRGSKSISLDAEITLRVGADATTSKLENVRIEKDQKLTLGSIEATIKELNTGSRTEIGFEAKQDFAAIKSIVFIGADGKPLDSKRAGSGRVGFGNDFTYSVSYTLPKDAKITAIEVETWTRVDSVKVRIQREIAIGL